MSQFLQAFLKHDPDQPRAAAGSDIGVQWIHAGNIIHGYCAQAHLNEKGVIITSNVEYAVHALEEGREVEVPEEKRIRGELVEVLKFGEAGAAAEHREFVEASDDELFTIYAECGMTPDDFVEGTAQRYAEYLERNATRRDDHA